MNCRIDRETGLMFAPVLYRYALSTVYKSKRNYKMEVRGIYQRNEFP